MQQIFVCLTFSIAVMVFTQGMPLTEDQCSTSLDCLIRPDGYCRTVDPCYLKYLLCLVAGDPSREWSETDMSNCANVEGDNDIAICKSTCTSGSCNSTAVVCAVNKTDSSCSLMSQCDLNTKNCASSSPGDSFPAIMSRCTDAGITNPGDTGKC